MPDQTRSGRWVQPDSSWHMVCRSCGEVERDDRLCDSCGHYVHAQPPRGEECTRCGKFLCGSCRWAGRHACVEPEQPEGPEEDCEGTASEEDEETEQENEDERDERTVLAEECSPALEVDWTGPFVRHRTRRTIHKASEGCGGLTPVCGVKLTVAELKPLPCLPEAGKILCTRRGCFPKEPTTAADDI